MVAVGERYGLTFGVIGSVCAEMGAHNFDDFVNNMKGITALLELTGSVEETLNAIDGAIAKGEMIQQTIDRVRAEKELMN